VGLCCWSGAPSPAVKKKVNEAYENPRSWNVTRTGTPPDRVGVTMQAEVAVVNEQMVRWDSNCADSQGDPCEGRGEW